jgi:hypothetical protein
LGSRDDVLSVAAGELSEAEATEAAGGGGDPAGDVTLAVEQYSIQRFVDTHSLHHLISQELIAEAITSGNPFQTILQRLPSDIDDNVGSTPIKMLKAVRDVIIPQMVQNTGIFVKDIQKATKLCSFSECNDSILMWSHYAKDHKGFCVEYDLTTASIYFS